MKKVFSAILALLVMCSFTCFPAFAQTLSIPGVVVDQTNGVTYTATYDSKAKSLTYTTAEDPRFFNDENIYDYDSDTVSEMILLALSQPSSASQKTKNAVLAYADYHYAPNLSISDLVRSGKVKKITINTPLGTNQYTGKKLTRIYEYEFKLNKSNQVIECYGGSETDNSGLSGSGGEYTFSYDSNGDLKSIHDELAHTPEHTTTFGYSNGKLNKLNIKSDVEGNSSQKVTTDSLGRPTKIKSSYDTATYTYDSNGRVKSYKTGDDDYSNTVAFNYNSLGQIESIDHTKVSEGKTTTTHFTFTYQTL